VPQLQPLPLSPLYNLCMCLHGYDNSDEQRQEDFETRFKASVEGRLLQSNKSGQDIVHMKASKNSKRKHQVYSIYCYKR
jgi:hypothetical protein